VEGTPFGRYRLVDQLGRGGMGEVWRAFDTVTERVVAIKVLPIGFADDHTYQTRLRREAKAAAGLNDPHVVPIHDFGEIDGRLFVTMRLVDGEDLQAIIDRGRLVGIDVFQYETPERANSVVNSLAPQWESCRGRTVTQNPGNFVFVISDLGVGDRHLNATLTMPGQSQRCLRVMQPASVFVIDVLACAPNLVDDRAQVMVTEMVAKTKG
jgi:hypothetical protein